MSTISEEDIEREVRTLKNLRRRSASSPGPGELPLDPDLPPADAFQAGHHHPLSSNDDISLAPPPGSDQSLFWVPAHLHPELAPGEFRAFLREHTQVNPTAVDSGETGEASLSRSPSWLARSRSLSGGLGRQKSMLSRQYTPRHGDKVEEEQTPQLTRRGSNRYAGRNIDTGPTLQELQNLEELVKNAEDSGDPNEMRRALRRSSMTFTTGAHDDQAPLPLDDEANSPIVLPRPGSIIRRTARTKIRKSGPGEGGSRRFSAQRSRHGVRLTSPIDGDESPRPSFEDPRPASGRWSDDQPRDLGDRGSDETGSEERRSESPGTSAESNEAKLADTSVVSSVATEETTGSTDDDEALIFDAYAHERTSSTASSVSDYDNRSRSPSPEHAHPRPAPIATPKASDANWYEDDELTPTQDSPMSAALHAMSLLPTAGPSDDIFMQDTSPQPLSSSSHQSPIYPQASQAPPPPHEQEKPHQMRIDTRPGTLTPGAAPRAKSPTEYTGSGLPPGMASPVHVSPSPIKSESSEYSTTPPTSAGPPAVVVERPPLMRVDSAASSVSTISGRESGREREKEKVKEKDRHRLFGKKDKKDKEKEKKREKDGFLGSLFGSKKKAEDTSSVSNFATAGPAAAAALLGTSKSAKSLHASGTSSPTSPAFNNFARYPIHVERAVYRLSHIKLANARRPLIEQVLISNLMFWYLGVIGRNPTQNEEKKGVTNGLDKNREESARNPQLKGTPPVPADTGSAGVRQDDPPPRVSSKAEHARAAVNEPIYRGPSPPERDAHSPPPQEPVRPQQQQSQQQQPQQAQTQQQPQSPQHRQPQPTRQPQPSRQPVVHQQGQQYPASGSMSPRSQSAPARQRSPPQSQQPPREYPPGVAPPRIPQQGQYGPPTSQSRPMSGDPRDPRQQRQPGSGAHHGQQMGSSRQGQGYQNGPRQEQRHAYPHNKHSGPQPGQIFQYPGGGAQHPRPPGAGGPQPGQLFSAAPQGYQQQQFQQQRPPQQQANWQPPQRLPSGGHGGNHANHSGHQQQQRVPPGAAMVDNPPRRTSSNPNAGGAYYGREEQQQFYGANNQRPANQYQYVPAPPGTSRQPVPSGQQYPHHR